MGFARNTQEDNMLETVKHMTVISEKYTEC